MKYLSLCLTALELYSLYPVSNGELYADDKSSKRARINDQNKVGLRVNNHIEQRVHGKPQHSVIKSGTSPEYQGLARRLQATDPTWVQLGSDIDGDRAGHKSGHAVSFSSDGTTVAIGNRAGYVRVYHWNGSDWDQRGLDIDGESGSAEFGRAVSLSANGETVAIGAPFNRNFAGRVHVYHWNNSSWEQLGFDIDGDRFDFSGHSISLSRDGKTIAIGAWASSSNGRRTGHAEVYHWNGSEWKQRGLDIYGEYAGDASGYSVSLSADGETVAIGANLNDDNGMDAGHVRVYHWNSSIWEQLGSDIDGEAALDESGFALSLSSDGATVAIGAHGNDDNGVNAGHVRVYHWNGSDWKQRGLDIDGESLYDFSGHSVSLSANGETVAIGAPYTNFNAGHVRIYNWNSSSWEQLGLDIDSEAAFDESGWAVSLSGDGRKVAIGAQYNDGNNGANSGHVRIFHFPSSQGTEGNGDPHFRTWKNEHYEFHGQCDLVMINDPTFAHGKGISIHLRTKLVRHWSFIATAAIRIGDDILEVTGASIDSCGEDSFNYRINYEYQGELQDLASFPVNIKQPGCNKQIYEIDLSPVYPGQSIQMKTFKEFVGVKVINASEEAFGRTVGMSGDYKTGNTYARDGVTVLNDFTELGLEWQVLPSDGILFHEVAKPQFPELCYLPEDPRGKRVRRLDESDITEAAATEACAGLKDEFDRRGCVYDILATQDLDMVGAY